MTKIIGYIIIRLLLHLPQTTYAFKLIYKLFLKHAPNIVSKQVSQTLYSPNICAMCSPGYFLGVFRMGVFD